MDFLSSFWGKKNLQLDPDDLRKTLDNMKHTRTPSNLADLVAFKESIEQKLMQHEEAQYFGGIIEYFFPSRVVVARDLTGGDLVAHFRLTNTVDPDGQVMYPEFLAPASGEGCSEWLAQSLNLGVDIFRSKRADITVIIDLIVMDVIQHLPQFQVLDHFTPGEIDPPEPPAVITGHTPLPPKRMKIRTYQEGTLCMTVGTGKDQTRIVGSYNAAFTCGYQMSPTERCCAPFMATHLIVLRVKRRLRLSEQWMYMGSDIEVATNHLTASLAMIYHAQEKWYEEYERRRGQINRDYGFGVVSDGEWCRFVYLDPQMTAHRSPVLMLKYDIMEILRYFRFIFDAIVADYQPPPTW